MLDFQRYVPEALKRWTTPKERPSPTPKEKDKPSEPLAEYVRASDGQDRHTRIRKTREERLSDSTTRERFLIESDVGKDEKGDRTFEAVGKRTAQFNSKDRIVYFEETDIGEEHRGSGLGTDSYKAFIDYVNRRAREIDLQGGVKSKEPWTVSTIPENPITKHQFEKFFHAQEQGPMMIGTLRTLEEIENEEKIIEARKKIDELTQRKAA